MKKRMPTPIKDGLIGCAFGTGAIIPGVAGGTVLLITGAYKKVVTCVANLFSKNFFRNFIVLLPFGIGALLAVAALVIPLNLALQNCLFATVCLFFGLIAGSLPGVFDRVKGATKKKSYIAAVLISFVFTALIGVLSVIFETSNAIDGLFADKPFYIYFVLLGVGFLTSSGLIVPGFSGSMFLVCICFYEPIIRLFKFENAGESLGLLATFLAGVIVGFVFFSKIMNYFMTNHRIGTYHASIGLVLGGLISIFVNSKMFGYIQSEKFGLLDEILGPVLLVVGFVASLLLVKYMRKHPELQYAEN